MRQGEVSSSGAWMGDPQGGVTAPDPLILPDPATRFARTAARLEARAQGHPMEGWLRFMAVVARAQQAACDALSECPAPGADFVAQAVEARMPPLALDGHRRAPCWRDGLAVLLAHVAEAPAPAPAQAREVARALKAAGAGAAEALADAFVHDSVEAGQAGEALFVAAALQAYFTRLAGALDASALRLLPERGLCPCCGSTPVASLVTASGKTPGARYLHCSICGTAWNYVRAQCVSCGESRSTAVRSFEGEELVKAETCDECRSYAKIIYQSKDTAADPYADDLLTLGLDLKTSEAGWARNAPNPLLLVG
ncbi:formate dehydrogenase accessory protein FdhE [Methylocella sp.]|uniref:formate dehydrogenase accessory protein FdhE n=1 Tax=Methylocella sp. TaxID=1978226 RepID=UPI0037834B9B